MTFLIKRLLLIYKRSLHIKKIINFHKYQLKINLLKQYQYQKFGFNLNKQNIHDKLLNGLKLKEEDIPEGNWYCSRCAPKMQKKLEKTYPHCIKIVNDSKKICSLDLKLVWELAYRDKSFPQFKYLVYTKSQELLFNQQFNLQPVLCANIQFVPNGKRNFQSIWHIIKQ